MKRTSCLLPVALSLLLGSLGLSKLSGDEPAQAHGAFRPPVRPEPPAVRGVERVRTPVDRFILAVLEAKGLSLAPEADRATLIRRVCFDLTGLPPTPADIDAFVRDKANDAYERMVERYLASPRYGERWGKVWLDTAGYADSNGYFSADTDRPLAWKYRDYVINSFNADKPYDRFVMEQLAGDELAGFTPDGDVTPQMVELLTATHFLRNAADGTGESDGNPDEVRTDRLTVLEGTLQITMNCLLGITIQCARCHEHKFEPISHKDYYSLQAIFFPVYNPDRWIKPKDRVVAVASRTERLEHQRRTELIERQVKALRDSLVSVAGTLRDQVLEERLAHLPAAQRDVVRQAVNQPKEQQTPEQQELLKLHAAAVKVSDADLARRFPEYAALRERVQTTIAEREENRPRPLEMLSVSVETDPNPPAHHLLKRGQHKTPGAEVEPGVPAALCSAKNTFRVEPRPEGRISTGRRTAFARWVTSPENPLFARVLVNRVWQHHFGTGLVATPDNLGQSGAKPSHPELLDWLATEFMAPSPPTPLPQGARGAISPPSPLGGEGRVRGWSIKTLHRLLLTSAVYRQSSQVGKDALDVDPDNHCLGRFPLQRLDAEALRDAMLAIAGELDVRMGGPYVPSKRTKEGNVEVAEDQEGARRRSVYLQQRRTQVVTFLQLFDAPSMVSTCSRRTTSTVPLQSLALLNAEFARARAKAFAARLAREAGGDTDRCLSLAFRLACGREPVAEEAAASRSFLAAQAQVYAAAEDGSERAWADLCHMVLASNAFLYVE